MSIVVKPLRDGGFLDSHTDTYMEQAEYRKRSFSQRFHDRMDYMFRPVGPVSKEAIRQINKIQDAIPYGKAWEVLEHAKNRIPTQMAAVDSDFKTQGKWHAASKIAQLWFFAPIVVMFSGRSPAHHERIKIRKAAKEWRTYLSKNPEGKRIISSQKGNTEQKQIDDIVGHIIAGKPPHAPR